MKYALNASFNIFPNLPNLPGKGVCCFSDHETDFLKSEDNQTHMSSLLFSDNFVSVT